jgi:pyrimidine operon attenuation protein/uracil phosphoribosyltransferase
MNYNVEQLLHKMAEDLRARLNARQVANPLMIGIHSGGVWVAESLHALLRLDEPLGKLDISFYRDDFTRIGLNPAVLPSELPFTVDGRHIILVDDVLYTGRTVRAALNEIFDYGRPDSVILAVLVDRGGRDLPIQADVVGTSMELSMHEHVKLSGPTPLELIIKQTP